MKILPSAIEGIVVVETARTIDPRGAFARFFCDRELAAVIGGKQIAQINYSRTTDAGTIRGMHYQRSPHAEIKLVRCLRGRVWDVAVDLREGSPTFLRWHAEELTPENARMLVIPEGCAHGFQTLEDDCELLYLHTAHYAPDAEGGVLFSEPRLNIKWPLSVTNVSERDRNHPSLSREFPGIVP